MKARIIALLALVIMTIGICSLDAADNSNPPAKQSIHVTSSEVAWQPVEKKEFPPGLELKRLHNNPHSKGGVAKLRFPSGYIEPKHYHTTAGHSVYVVSGRINYMGVIATAGDFIYTPTNVVHGLIALETTEILLWSDGPMDFNLSDINTEK